MMICCSRFAVRPTAGRHLLVLGIVLLLPALFAHAEPVEIHGIEVIVCGPCWPPPTPIFTFAPEDFPINLAEGASSVVSTLEYDAETGVWSGHTQLAAAGAGGHPDGHGAAIIYLDVSGAFEFRATGTLQASGNAGGSAIAVDGISVLAEVSVWCYPEACEASEVVDVAVSLDGSYRIRMQASGGNSDHAPIMPGNGSADLSWTITPLGATTVYFWEGLNGDFADETNWEPEGVPGANSLAIFDKDQGYTVSFGDEESARAFVERGYAVFSGGSYTLGDGSLDLPSLSVGNDAADQADVLLVHGHQLETTFAALGRQSNNQGTLQVSGVGQPTHWRSQGRLTIGEAGEGTVQVVLGGTLDADEVILGQQHGSEGHLEIFAVGAVDEPTVTLGNVALGWSGAGFLKVRREVGDEPLVPLVTGTLVMGAAADGSGGVTMSDGYWRVAELVVGSAGYGVVLLHGENFVTVTGTEPTVIGDHSTSLGTFSMSGESTSVADLKDVIVGRRGQGQILIEAGSLLVGELLIGEYDAAEGEVRIMGTEGVLGVRQSVVVGAGSSGANRLWLGPGADGVVDGSVLVGIPVEDDQPQKSPLSSGSGETDVLLVEGAHLRVMDGLAIGGPQVLDSGFPSGAMVLLMVAIIETSELIVNGGGAVLGQGTIELTGGLPAIISGTLSPGVVVWQQDDDDDGGQKQLGPLLRRDEGFASLTIDGDLELSGGVLELSVGGAEAGQADQLVVTGDLVLDQATLQLDFTDGYGPQEGDALSLVAVGGAFTGAFGEVVITGLEEGFEYELDLSGGEVVLVALNDATVGIQSDPDQPLPDPVPVITTLRLYPNQPNPFNPQTVLVYEVPQPGVVRLEVFDLRGRLVQTLVDETRTAGRHEVLWDGRDTQGREQPSGVYLSRLRADGREAVGRMTLVR